MDNIAKGPFKRHPLSVKQYRNASLSLDGLANVTDLLFERGGAEPQRPPILLSRLTTGLHFL